MKNKLWIDGVFVILFCILLFVPMSHVSKEKKASFENRMLATYRPLYSDMFTSQKMNKPYNRVSISRMFGLIYNTFGIKGASHLGRHLFVSKLVNAGVNICLVQKLDNHRNIGATQRYFNYNEKMLANAVENVRV